MNCSKETTFYHCFCVIIYKIAKVCAYESNVGRSLPAAVHAVKFRTALVKQLELVHVCVAVELGGYCVLVTVDYLV